MKNFLLSSFLLLLLACARQTVPVESGAQEKISPDILNAPFSNGYNSYFFKTQADIYGQYLSGLLLIKPVGDTSYRIVFTTEIGIKLFDFEFQKEKFIVHYCMDKLNRKPVIKVLEKDFRLLLLPGISNKTVQVKSEYSHKVYTWKQDKEYFSYYQDQDKKIIDTMKILSEKRTPKVQVELQNYQKNFPANIRLVHDNIKLTIELKYLER